MKAGCIYLYVYCSLNVFCEVLLACELILDKTTYSGGGANALILIFYINPCKYFYQTGPLYWYLVLWGLGTCDG